MRFVFKRTGNEKGFLLLEHLIAIAITGIVSAAFLSIMQVISGYAVNQNTLTMHEVNTTAIRLQNEVRFASFLTISQGRLDVHFAHSEDVVNFFILNNRLVRRVNGVGGEVIIHHVASMDVIAHDSNSARVVLNCLADQEFSFALSTLQLQINFAEIEPENDDKAYEEGCTDEYLEE